MAKEMSHESGHNMDDEDESRPNKRQNTPNWSALVHEKATTRTGSRSSENGAIQTGKKLKKKSGRRVV